MKNYILHLKKFSSRFGFATSLLLISAVLITLAYNVQPNSQQQFSLLTYSFLDGKLSIDYPDVSWLYDTTLYEGKYYWPLGPFPSIILLPFVALFKQLNIFLLQGYIQFPIFLATFYLLYKLTRKNRYQNRSAIFLAFAFCFSSIFLPIVMYSSSWYFSHIVAVFLLVLSLYHFSSKKNVNYLYLGLIFGFIFMTRFTAGLVILFFLLNILLVDKYSLKTKLKHIMLLIIPVVISGLVLLSYNYLRFENVWDNGYRKSNKWWMSETQRYELINHGLFKSSNIPTNIYYYFFKSFDPVLVEQESYLGNSYILKPPFIKVGYPNMSFFIVSPIFLYVFKLRPKKRYLKNAIATILVILTILLSYYYTGWYQVGPRYMLDVLPLFYILLLNSFKNRKLGNFTKAIITLSAFFNFYLFNTLFHFHS